jgi:hypothetical protein
VFTRRLRHLGRLGKRDEAKEPFFALDTCLVVDRVQSLPAGPFDESSYGSDIVEDTALFYFDRCQDVLLVLDIGESLVGRYFAIRREL